MIDSPSPLDDPAERRAQLRRARRTAAWIHHPDRGGTAAEFIAAVAEFDVGTNRSRPADVLFIRRTRRARLSRRLHLWRQRRMTRRYFTL